LVSRLEHGLFNCRHFRFQLLFGGLHPHLLKVFQHGKVGSLFKPSLEGSSREIYRLGQFIDGQLLLVTVLDIFLYLFDQLVIMMLVSLKNQEMGLVLTVQFHLKIF